MPDEPQYKAEDLQTGESWNTYWQGATSSSALNFGGVNHPAIDAFWAAYLPKIGAAKKALTHLDLASGNGAVIEAAKTALKQTDLKQSALDLSESAIRNIKSRYPEVSVYAGDASSTPFESASYDLVTSQFGIEYAGIQAVFEAARLVGDKGKLMILMHRNPGIIYRECQLNHTAITRLRSSQFIPLSKTMFQAAYTAIKGGSRLDYEKSATSMSKAVSELEQIMSELGKDIAGGTIAKLYDDVASIHERLVHHEPDSVLSWLSNLEDEIEDYQLRMSSMMNSAISSEDFKQVCNKIVELNFEIEISDSLLDADTNQAISWVLVANKN